MLGEEPLASPRDGGAPALVQLPSIEQRRGNRSVNPRLKAQLQLGTVDQLAKQNKNSTIRGGKLILGDAGGSRHFTNVDDNRLYDQIKKRRMQTSPKYTVKTPTLPQPSSSVLEESESPRDADGDSYGKAASREPKAFNQALSATPGPVRAGGRHGKSQRQNSQKVTLHQTLRTPILRTQASRAERAPQELLQAAAAQAGLSPHGQRDAAQEAMVTMLLLSPPPHRAHGATQGQLLLNQEERRRLSEWWSGASRPNGGRPPFAMPNADLPGQSALLIPNNPFLQNQVINGTSPDHIHHQSHHQYHLSPPAGGEGSDARLNSLKDSLNVVVKRHERKQLSKKMLELKRSEAKTARRGAPRGPGHGKASPRRSKDEAANSQKRSSVAPERVTQLSGSGDYRMVDGVVGSSRALLPSSRRRLKPDYSM